MTNNGDILSLLIEEDFGLDTRDGSRWGKAEEHSSMVLDKEKGIFFWNSQNIVGDPLVYLTKVRGYSFNLAKEYLIKYNYSGTFVYTIRSAEEDVVVYPRLVEIFFEDGLEKREYFYKRGLDDGTINRFQLGYYDNYYTVPFFQGGTFRNFQLRQEEPAKRIKGYYRGVGPLLFNSDVLKFSDEIYYVEGPVDAMILVQNGLPAISSNCGGGYKPDWYGLFTKQKRINIVFDNDAGGRSEARRLAKFLGVTRCKIYTFQDSEEEKYDPVDFFRDGYSAEQFVDIVEKESKYIFE